MFSTVRTQALSCSLPVLFVTTVELLLEMTLNNPSECLESFKGHRNVFNMASELSKAIQNAVSQTKSDHTVNK